MRILYFAETIKSNQDGVTRVLDKIIEYNKKNGIEFLFITSVADGNENANIDFILTRSLPIPGYKGYRFSISTESEIIKMLNGFKPDLIHIHSPFLLGWMATRIARKLDIPCIATYHTHFVSYVKYYGSSFLEPLLNAHNRLVYNACDLTIAPSQWIYSYLKEIHVQNLLVLSHGVDLDVFNPKFKSQVWRSQYSSDKRILLYVGRIVWEKNLKILADVLNELYSVRNDFEFVFIGDGPALESLKKIIPRAYFAGLKTGEELSTIYASSDVFVFPSETETFGNVTLEAMASGLPCIVANKGGSVDLVKEMESGLLFNPYDSLGLKKAITLMLDNPEIRDQLSSGALEMAERYSWSTILAKQEEIYRNLIKKNLNVSDTISVLNV